MALFRTVDSSLVTPCYRLDVDLSPRAPRTLFSASSTMPPLLPGAPSRSQVTSSALFGALLNFLLFGMLIIQVCVYAICFPQDRRAVKALVYTVFLMMLVSICFNAADAHFWYAANFGDLTTFGEARFSAFYTPIIGSLVGFLVQGFFVYRISMFRGAMWVAAFIALVSLAQVGGGMASGLSVYLSEIRSGGLENTFVVFVRTPLLYLWLIGSAVADLAIAISMTYLLLNAVEPSTQHIVGRVVRVIIETNALTASVAVIALGTFSGFPGMTYFICPTMLLPGLYANTLLVVLNNRASPSRTQPPTRDSSGPTHSLRSDTYPSKPIRIGAFDSPQPNRDVYPPRSSMDKTTSRPPLSLRKEAGGQPFTDSKGGNGIRSSGTSTIDSLDFEEIPYGNSGSYTHFR
ncbi:hypothetical protein C8J57DRAFT_1276302 [Mycena rebaudengoi]|nr:hypothetical protein C8J57DRAFT_1276302 [Mycena rebaudengoi]